MPVVNKDPATLIAYMERVIHYVENELTMNTDENRAYIRGYRAAIKHMREHMGVKE